MPSAKVSLSYSYLFAVSCCAYSMVFGKKLSDRSGEWHSASIFVLKFMR